MFVLHYLDRNGKPNGIVRERDCYPMAGEYGVGSVSPDSFDPVRVNHSSTARGRAHVASLRAECHVQVSREAPDGTLRPAYIVRADGSSLAPAGMVVPEREQHRDSGPCFCTACRADRAAARRRAWLGA